MALPVAKLDRFLAKLPEGFEYGVQQRLDLRRLLLGLSDTGQLPGDTRALKTLLTPMVCSSREQQTDFYQLFDAEFAGADRVDVLPPVRPPERRVRWLPVAAVLAALIVLGSAVAGVAIWRRPPVASIDRKPPAPPTPPPVTPPMVPAPVKIAGHVVDRTGKPIGGAEVWVPGQSTTTAKDGSFELASAQTGPIPYLAAHRAYQATMGSFSGSPWEVSLRPWKETPRPAVGRLSEAGGPYRFWVRSPTTMAISPNYAIAVQDDGGPIRILGIFSGNEISQFPSLGGGVRLAFSDDGTGLLEYAADGRIRIHRTQDWSTPYSLGLSKGETITAATAESANLEGVLIGHPQGKLVIGQLGSRFLYPFGSIPDSIDALAWLPFPDRTPGIDALVAGHNAFWTLSTSQPFVESPTLQKLYTSHRNVPITGIGVDFTTHYLAVLGKDGTLDVWDTYGQRVRSPGQWPAKAGAFAFSGNSGDLWTATVDGTLASRLRPLRWLAGLVPAAAIAFWFWWIFRRRARLNRLSIDRELKTHSLSPPKPEPLFTGTTVRHLSLEMRKRRRAPSTGLAPEATVRTTARSAGFFSPVFETRSYQREFLILIKKDGTGDQQELLYRSLIKALKDEHVLIDHYTFHGSPATIHDRPGGWTDLKELSARHPDHVLWIVADPAEFLDPFAPSLPVWTQELARWQDRAIFSPVEVDGRLRVLLEDDGVRAGVASVEGFEAVLAAMEGETTPPIPKPPAVPKVFRHLRHRLVERHFPGENTATTVREDLPCFLGADGMLLAGACSVYPETLWGMTCWLAEKLLPEKHSRTNALIRLTSTPWFRFGSIPNWMRARLVNTMSDSARSKVRESIEAYLAGAEPGAGDLTVAPADRGRIAPVRDYVMLSFLLGLKVDERQAVKAPSNWMWMLYQDGRFAFGPRVLFHAGAALVLGAGAWFAANYGLGFIPARIELTPWTLPAAGKPIQAPARAFPANRVQRAILEVADAMVGTPANATFEQDVVSRAGLFLEGAQVSRQPGASATPAPGLTYGGGVIESVSGRQMTIIQPQSGQIARVETPVPPGPFRDYSKGPTVPVPAPQPPVLCTGPDTLVFDNWNAAAVSGGGRSPTIDTSKFGGPAGALYCLDSIATYHWNGGKGAAPGTIGLLSTLGTQIGPSKVVGEKGKGNAPNVNWVVNYPMDRPTIALRGTYTVQDSSPSTWSQNTASGGLGFFRIHARVGTLAAKWVAKPMEAKLGIVRGVAWNPDGRRLAATGDLAGGIWDAANGAVIQTFPGEGVGGAWNPAGTTLAMVGNDQTVRLWDAVGRRLISTLQGPPGRTGSAGVAWSPDGKFLASEDLDGTTRIWDGTGAQLLRTLPPPFTGGLFPGFAWSPDGKTLASTGSNGSIYLQDAADGKSRSIGHSKLQTYGGLWSVAWSPNGKTVASGNEDGTVILWDAVNGQSVITLKSGFAKSIAWNPDGRTLAAGIVDGTILLWDTATGQLVQTLKSNAPSVESVAWSRDGKKLASGGGDGAVIVWSQDASQTAPPQGSATVRR